MKRMAPGVSARKRYGVIFPGIDGNPLVARGVEPGSVAEAADLKGGDIILRMNDCQVVELDSQARVSMLLAKLAGTGHHGGALIVHARRFAASSLHPFAVAAGIGMGLARAGS